MDLSKSFQYILFKSLAPGNALWHTLCNRRYFQRLSTSNAVKDSIKEIFITYTDVYPLLSFKDKVLLTDPSDRKKMHSSILRGMTCTAKVLLVLPVFVKLGFEGD